MNDSEAAAILKSLKKEKSAYWESVGHRHTLRLFHAMAERVPAYKDFLKKNKINHTKIKTWSDFQTVPLMNKKNYLRQYPLEKLCWDGTLKRPLVFTSTSGSTGEPFYFPRQEMLDWQYSIIVESYLHRSLRKEQPTLAIVCFGMGVWIGGLITYKAFELAAKRMDAPLSIITPGINKPEIFSALKNLAPQYKQVIVIGYPPFIKDIIDESEAEGINLRKLPLRFMFAAEAFTEEYRNYLAANTGIKNPLVDTLNIYGSADMGAMAYESTTSILIKRLLLGKKEFTKEFFASPEKVPTVAQFNPEFIQFEAPGGEIALSANNALPLMRYAIGDRGGVFTYQTIREFFKGHAIDLLGQERKNGLEHVELPFVYIYERSDFSTKLYGAIIYPEHIREVLFDPLFQKYVTGKFTMATKFKNNEEYFELNLELKAGAKIPATVKVRLTNALVHNLLEKNSEYHNNYATIPHKVIPKLVFWDHGDPLYFKPGIKQKWVKK